MSKATGLPEQTCTRESFLVAWDDGLEFGDEVTKDMVVDWLERFADVAVEHERRLRGTTFIAVHTLIHRRGSL